MPEKNTYKYVMRKKDYYLNINKTKREVLR